MIEITGWINISVSFDGEHESHQTDNAIIEISNLIESEIVFNQMFNIQNLNGNYVLFIGLNHNHDNGYSDSILKLLNEISKIAIGSYGLVYIRNHESLTDSNMYKVLRLAKGKVSIEDDKLLSPCRPVIED